MKPTELMRYLCRLVTPPNGIVLDPFMGSGSTGKAAMLEGFRFVGVDMTEEYVGIAEARIQKALNDSNGLLIPVFRFSNHIADAGNMVKNVVLTKK